MESTEEQEDLVILEGWSVGGTVTQSQYMSPELVRKCLIGKVKNHPRFKDGILITTSTIQEAKGRIVKTQNTNYYLSNIDPEYLKWMEENGIEYNVNNPVKIRK